MTSLVKADEKGRVPIRGTEKGRQYLVTKAQEGWWVIPAPEHRPPQKKRRAWTGSKKSLAEHLQGLGEEGLRIEQADNATSIPRPCRF